MSLKLGLIGALILVVVALAGCIGQNSDTNDDLEQNQIASAGGETLELADAEGDATVQNAGYAAGFARSACQAFSPTTGTCFMAMGTARGALPLEGIGTPAPPSLDVVSVALSETPDALIVELGIASLDEAFTGIFDGDNDLYANYNTNYAVCWSEDEWKWAGECVAISPKMYGDQVVLDWWAFDEYSGKCNWWWWCSQSVSIEIEYGTPATMRWTVPRAIMPNGTLGDKLDTVQGVIMRWTMVGAGGSYSIAAPDPVGPVGGWLNPQSSYSIDATELGEFTFLTEMSPTSVRLIPSYPYMDYVDDVGAAGAEMDILLLDVDETPTHLTIATKMATVEERPADHGFYVGMGMPSARVYDIGYDVEDGIITPSAGAPDDVEYRQYRNVPVHLERVVGSPGWVNFTFIRSDLEPLAAGDMINMLWSSIGVASPDYPRLERGAGPVFAGVGGSNQWKGDWSNVGPTYVFVHDTVAVPVTEREVGAVVTDELGDVEPPGVAGIAGTSISAEPDQFDVTFLEALPYTLEMSRVTLGIKDLSKIDVPMGYDAVAYAVALETPQGPFMAAYYKEGETDRQEFFCAADTLVFAEERQDPNEVVWQTIEGLVSVSALSQREGSGGGGSSGSITFFVPHSCTGAADVTRLDVNALAGGSYLVRKNAVVPREAPPQVVELDPQIAALDTVRSDQPITLMGFAPPPTTWSERFQEPFGVQNFWDIMGIVGAGLIFLAGIALVQRRRRVLKRYLAEIERTSAALHEDPEAKREALVGMAARLKGDLLRSKISEEHFVIVERRLEEHLGRKPTNGHGTGGDVADRLERIEKMMEELAKRERPRPRSFRVER